MGGDKGKHKFVALAERNVRPRTKGADRNLLI